MSVARRTNTRWIKLGRVDIRHATVSCLPFTEDMFDLVTAVETHFFWPDLVADLHEVRRVLKPGGKLIIIAEVYAGGKYDQVLQKLAGWWNLALQSGTEYRDLFSRAGYAAIQIFEHYDKGWICVIGEKPAEGAPGEASPGRDDEGGMEQVRPKLVCSTPEQSTGGT